MKRSGNMPQATLDRGRFPWKSETVVHFTRLPLEEGWHWGSITMLPLFLHQTHTSVIIPIWQHVASVSLERVLSALGKVPLTIISGTLYHYTWVCIQHYDVCMYVFISLHMYFRDMVQTSRENVFAGPMLLPPSIYLNRLTYSTATRSWESTLPLDPFTTDLNRTCGWD